MDICADMQSIAINIISSIMYDLAKYAGGKLAARLKGGEIWNEESIKIQLQRTLEQFLARNEGDLFFDSDWFADFWQYRQPDGKILEYVLGNSPSHQAFSEDDFLNALVLDAEEAAQARGRGLSSRDKSVLKELFQLLIDGIEQILRRQMDPVQQYSLRKFQEAALQAEKACDAGVQRIIASGEKTFSEKSYEYPRPYLSRHCRSQENDLTGESGEKGRFAGRFRLAEICRAYPWVVVLGEAGSGKSTELQWTAAYYCENVDLPRPVYLTLKTYMDETIEELAEKQGFLIHKAHSLFFLIDGFDEISGGNRQNFLKQLTAYHDQNPEARFLVSSRNNFYRQGILGDWFKTVWMDPLKMQDVVKFIRESGIDDQAFLSEIKKQNLRELLLIPFYLMELCGIYREKGVLPQRNQLMGELIEHKFAEDLKKFRMTMDEDLAELKPQIFFLLQKIAVAIHTMDCNWLPEEDYRKLIPSEKDRGRLSFSGIWKRRQDGWQFTHNNFGEYLAAEYLSRCSLDEIKVLVSAGHPELGICRNWHHVLSYLLFMENKQAEEWLLDQDFTLFFDVDSSRVPAAARSKILQKEWERLKCRYEWITRQPYRVEELMRFGVNYPEIHMFLDEIKNPSHIISQQNAILALEYCPERFGCDDRIKETLMEACMAPQEHECVYERAILGLLEMDLMGGQELARLMERFGKADASEVRYALYRSIRVLGKADEYIRFLTEGLPYVSEAGGIHGLTGRRLGNESFELHYALMEVKEPAAAMEIVKELTKNRAYFHLFQIEQVVENIFLGFAERGVQVTGDQWRQVVEFYEEVSDYGWRSMEKAVLAYAASSGKETALFEDQLTKIIEGKHPWIRLIRLLDDTVSRWVLEQYGKGRMDDRRARWCIDCMPRENPAFAPLTAIYREKTGVEIPDKPKIDYDKLRREGKAGYQKAVTDKERYLFLIDELIRLHGKGELAGKDMEGSLLEEEQNRYDLAEVRADYCRSDYPGTVGQWRDTVEKDWENWGSWLLINWLYMDEHGNGAPERDAGEREKDPVPDEIKAAAKRYFDRNIGTADFAKAVVWLTDQNCRIMDWRCCRLLYFAWRFDFRMEKERAEGILAAARMLDEKRIKELLDRHFSEGELRLLVLRNMTEKELKGDDLHLHLWYCTKWKISQCAEIVCRIAVDGERPEWIRRRAVDYVCQVLGGEVLCRMVLPWLEGDLFLEAVSRIWDSRPEGLADLLWAYAEKNEKGRFFCYRQLILLQDGRGLKAYRRALERERKIGENTPIGQPLESIGNIRKEELWGELFELAKLWLRPDFEDAEYNGLSRALGTAFSGMAGRGERGFCAVKAMLEELWKEQEEMEETQAETEEKQAGFWKKGQIQHWMGEVKESYKQSVQRKWTVDQVKEYIFS